MSQQSKTTLQSAINTQIVDNTSGDISAADIRDNLINITDSLLFNTGSGQSLTGSLNVTEGITIVSGSLTITGSINSTGSVFLGKLDQFGFNRNLSISFNNESETAILAAGATRANKVQFVSSTGTSTLSAGSICEIISPVVNIIAPTTNITGSAIISGSLIVTGSITPTGGFTGSLLGTASYATQALSASYAPASSPYLVYTALLSLSNGTFTVNQLQNTIGDGSNTSPNDIQWSNPSNGVIRGTKSGAFNENTDLIIFVPSIRLSGVSYFVAGGLSSYFDGSIQYAPTLTITRHDNDQSSTPNFTNLPIEIRVYN